MRHDEIPYLEASEMRRKVNEMRYQKVGEKN